MGEVEVMLVATSIPLPISLMICDVKEIISVNKREFLRNDKHKYQRPNLYEALRVKS